MFDMIGATTASFVGAIGPRRRARTDRVPNLVRPASDRPWRSPWPPPHRRICQSVLSRLMSRPARSVGPRPFSAEWVAAPKRPPATRPLLALPPWVPGESTLAAALVLLMTLAIALIALNGAMPRFQSDDDRQTLTALPGGQMEPAATSAVAVAMDDSAAPLAASAAPAEVAADVGSAAPLTADTAPGMVAVGAALAEAAVAGPSAFVPAPAPASASQPESVPGAILPGNRVLAYYGHPHDENMGIVGASEGSKARAVLMSVEELEDRLGSTVRA